MALPSLLGPLHWLSSEMQQQGWETRTYQEAKSPPGQTPFCKWGSSGPERPSNLFQAASWIGCLTCVQAAWGEGPGKPHVVREAYFPSSSCPRVGWPVILGFPRTGNFRCLNQGSPGPTGMSWSRCPTARHLNGCFLGHENQNQVPTEVLGLHALYN